MAKDGVDRSKGDTKSNSRKREMEEDMKAKSY